MSNPGFMGQQAAQQASASASRAAQQQASMAQQQMVQNASRAAHSHYSARPARRGGFGLLGRLVGLVFTLVSLAIAAGVFLLILSQAQPQWFHGVMTWLDRLF